MNSTVKAALWGVAVTMAVVYLWVVVGPDSPKLRKFLEMLGGIAGTLTLISSLRASVQGIIVIRRQTEEDPAQREFAKLLNQEREGDSPPNFDL